MSKIFIACVVSVTHFAIYIDRKNDIYQHLQDPTQENRENQILGSCYFQCCPPGVPGTDRDHLKDTQEADATDGHSPPHSVQKKVCRPKSLQICFHPKTAIVCETPLQRRTKELATIWCLRIKSVDLNL